MGRLVAQFLFVFVAGLAAGSQMNRLSLRTGDKALDKNDGIENLAVGGIDGALNRQNLSGPSCEAAIKKPTPLTTLKYQDGSWIKFVDLKTEDPAIVLVQNDFKKFGTKINKVSIENLASFEKKPIILDFIRAMPHCSSLEKSEAGERCFIELFGEVAKITEQELRHEALLSALRMDASPDEVLHPEIKMEQLVKHLQELSEKRLPVRVSILLLASDLLEITRDISPFTRFRELQTEDRDSFFLYDLIEKTSDIPHNAAPDQAAARFETALNYIEQVGTTFSKSERIAVRTQMARSFTYDLSREEKDFQDMILELLPTSYKAVFQAHTQFQESTDSKGHNRSPASILASHELYNRLLAAFAAE